jgi:hypothetical protein
VAVHQHPDMRRSWCWWGVCSPTARVSGWEYIDELVFMHDGAPPHFALSVRSWLNRKFAGRWLWRRRPQEWPERSPDLTSCDFFLWGWVKEEVYNTSHNWTLRGPDSEGYHQRPTRLPAEDCAFHPRSFEEADGCRRRLHWILSYEPIFPFKKVHVKINFLILPLEMQKLWPFLNAYLLSNHSVYGHVTALKKKLLVDPVYISQLPLSGW